jgi:HD-like signal output (HDOD) protein
MAVQATSGELHPAEPVRSEWEQALIDKLLQTFASPDYNPPLLPGAAMQLLALARDPDIATSKVVALLETEPLIVARVIRAAQSPLYSGGSRIQTIDDALRRLGTKQVALVFAEAAMNTEVFSSERFKAPMQALRRHGAATAHIARKLAERSGQPGDRVYLGGLLHDIGIVACLLVAPDFEGPGGKRCTFEQLQAPIHAVHEQAGEILSSLWSLPQGLTWILSHHHNFTLRTHVSPIAALICLASWIAGEAGAGVIDAGDQPRALAAATHFGWGAELGALVQLGEKLVTELGGGDA